ncbi:hypothetical protein BAE44_0010063 [Dichanthelium oligosanthes]|uniref:Cystatin domain-containing protein n=1 Tax=Dichanthelium oligosanthes TaxID=888268 RepID=A0A1E5VUW6_9POAL|nr:hypothetical protein BAE44_0010063 [Dichanthelium oligosanthes]
MPTTVVSSQEWDPLPVVSAPLVQELGKWAVKEHDKKAKDNLKFKQVVSGEEMDNQQLGMKYHFVIDALDGNGKGRKYEAVLAEQVWLDRRILISFNPAS